MQIKRKCKLTHVKNFEKEMHFRNNRRDREKEVEW